MSNKLYVCDGQACGNEPEYCFLNGGKCVHTTDVNHSLKAKFQDKFPPTTFVEFCPGILAEEIDPVKFFQELYSGKTYSLKGFKQ